MSAFAMGGIVFACVFGGALLGLFLRSMLPDHHRSAESKDVVKLGIGLLATMAALVLSLLIASAKTSYDMQSNDLVQLAANVALLDRILGHYGAETADARAFLRHAVARILDEMWPKNGSRPAELSPAAARAAPLYDKIQALAPRSELQRALRAEALRIAIDLARTRSLLLAQSAGSIPLQFLVILVFWLAVIFTSFGLFAPPNATVVATLFVCALSVSAAIFLVLELDQPFAGAIRMSSAPLRETLAHLGQ